MKAKFIALIVLLGFTPGLVKSIAACLAIDLSQVPVAVQRTINEYLGDGELKQLLPQNYQGKHVYDAYIKRPGLNRELHIAADGTVLENDPDFLARASALRMNRPQLTDLPLVVQNAIRSELGTTPIDDIDQETFNGQTVYSVEFQRDRQFRKSRSLLTVVSSARIIPMRWAESVLKAAAPQRPLKKFSSMNFLPPPE